MGRGTRRIDPPTRGLHRLRRPGRRTLEIAVDGEPVTCFEGETIAVALLADRGAIGRDAVRLHGLWCGIGTCFECVVTVDGSAGIRACMTTARSGMRVGTAIGRASDSGDGDSDADSSDGDRR